MTPLNVNLKIECILYFNGLYLCKVVISFVCLCLSDQWFITHEPLDLFVSKGTGLKVLSFQTSANDKQQIYFHVQSLLSSLKFHLLWVTLHKLLKFYQNSQIHI